MKTRYSKKNCRLQLQSLEDRTCPTGTVLTADGDLPLPTTRVNGTPLGPNDTITMQVFATTDDPGQNAESDVISLDTPSGQHFQTNTYDQIQAFVFKPAPGDTSIHVSGFDGDQSVDVDFVVNQLPRYTPQQKADFSATADTLGKLGALYLVSGSDDPDTGEGDELTQLGVATLYVAGRINDLAADPPDPNFTTVQQPTPFMFTPIVAQGKITQAEADAGNALLKSECQIIGLANAASTAVNRANSAAAAGDKTSEQAQVQAINQFSAQVGATTGQLPKLLGNLGTALQSGGFSQAPSATDVSTFQSNTSTNGLPSAALAFLQQNGVSSTDIKTLTQLAEVQDASKVAGSLPAKFTDPQVTGALQTLSNDLASMGSGVASGTGPATSTSPGTNMGTAMGSSVGTSSGLGSSSGTTMMPEGNGGLSQSQLAQDALINALVIANFKAVFAQPLPPGIALAMITAIQDVNGDGFADITAVIGLNTKVNGRNRTQIFTVTFDGLSGDAIDGPKMLGLA
jgi:hypothetical protein